MDELALSELQRRRLKAAFKALVFAAGGPTLAAGQSGQCKGAISRCASPDYPDLPNIAHVALLETATHEPHVTWLLAEIAGFRLQPTAEEEAGCGATHMATVAGRFSAVVESAAAAMADGVMTPREAAGIEAAMARLDAGLAAWRRSVAQRLPKGRG